MTPAKQAYANAGNWIAYYQAACSGGDNYTCSAASVAHNIGGGSLREHSVIRFAFGKVAAIRMQNAGGQQVARSSLGVALGVAAFAAALLGGCSAEVYKIDGVEDRFCLPREYVVPDIPWVPPDPPGAPKVFAFQGCWHSSTASTCVFPSNVLGGVVLPKSSYPGWRWQDMGEDDN